MFAQPPSGGCVLKPDCDPMEYQKLGPAAFRRLCVETNVFTGRRFKPIQPPSGGCVLKHEYREKILDMRNQPPSGGYVLKHNVSESESELFYPAAFRRLCVETTRWQLL